MDLSLAVSTVISEGVWQRANLLKCQRARNLTLSTRRSDWHDPKAGAQQPGYKTPERRRERQEQHLAQEL